MSAQAIATTATEAASVLESYTAEQIDVLRNHIAGPTFTKDEMAYCLTVARARGLDPFQKQVYFTKRKKKVGDGWVDAVTVEPTIDGFRVIAERTGEMDGYDPPAWCGPDGVWRDVWLDDKPPAAARCVVRRKGCAGVFVAIAKYSSYVQTGKDNVPNHIWQKMPDNQLLKCAKAAALREAFPSQLGEFYSREEMGQADNPSRFETLPQEARPQIVAAKSAPANGFDPLPAQASIIPTQFMTAHFAQLNGLGGVKLDDLSYDDLELVIDVMRKGFAVAVPRGASQLERSWYQAIAERCKAIIAERDNPQPPPAES